MELASARPKSTWYHVLTLIFWLSYSETCLLSCIGPYRPNMVVFFPSLMDTFFAASLKKNMSLSTTSSRLIQNICLSFIPGAIL